MTRAMYGARRGTVAVSLMTSSQESLMRAQDVITLAGLLALGTLPRPAAAQQAQVKPPEITVYKVPT